VDLIATSVTLVGTQDELEPLLGRLERRDPQLVAQLRAIQPNPETGLYTFALYGAHIDVLKDAIATRDPLRKALSALRPNLKVGGKRVPLEQTGL
jgi:hypothetical protein